MLTAKRKSVTIQVPLAEASPDNLLTGSEAVVLIGQSSISDVVLQPSEGEFILASTSYLTRNPFFAAYQSFSQLSTPSNDSTVLPVKLNPPFTSAFRVVLECIYAHDLEFCQNVFSVNNFVPLFVNGQYFQEENILAAGLDWFHTNWKVAIKSDTFCSGAIGQDLVSKLLEKFKMDSDAAARFEILLEWAQDWDQDSSSMELREFVEREVSFENIPQKQWANLGAKYVDILHLCVSGKEIHRLALSGELRVHCIPCRTTFTIIDKKAPCGHFSFPSQ
ncbi:hypothetical protein HDU79_010822 [Rhizoclosmatium sp. JEL0117]|nr:hypothetical protein HDU79_010822 [Rhizoclosmatium sp. JEL0117]